MIALAVYIIINPDTLTTITVSSFNGRIYDSNTAFFIVFFTGIIIILLGSGFLAFTNIFWKYLLKADKELASKIDSSIPKTSHLLDRVKKTPNYDPKNDKISKLERLGKLKDQGILSEVEFQQEKQIIIKEQYLF
jgi:hypothetical protein